MIRLKSINKFYLDTCQKVGAFKSSPSATQIQGVLFLIGVCLLVSGITHEAAARQGGQIQYNAVRITDSTNAVLTYLEGSFGALVMVASGIGSILSAAFGQYKASLGLMVVAIGAFILRSLMGTFFNDTDIQG